MLWIVSRMKWIMLLSGVLTSTMIYAAIAPDAALQSTFGETLTGPLAQIVVRNWGALIALIGAMLIYGAFNPASRPLVLTVAGKSVHVPSGETATLAQGGAKVAPETAFDDWTGGLAVPWSGERGPESHPNPPRRANQTEARWPMLQQSCGAEPQRVGIRP
jgi:hypothetical protein